MNKKVSVAVGDSIMVRLALLATMPQDAKDLTTTEFAQVVAARNGDPAALDVLVKARTIEGSPAPTVEQLNDELFLYPRRRYATVTYVDKTTVPGKSSITGKINVDVKTLGSTVMQPAVGHYPLWAQETFRLENLQFFDEEPKDAQDVHVAYPVPEPV